MNDKIFDIDMNVWDTAINLAKLISLHPFHGQGDSLYRSDIVITH
jgi:hypothetical protein